SIRVAEAIESTPDPGSTADCSKQGAAAKLDRHERARSMPNASATCARSRPECDARLATRRTRTWTENGLRARKPPLTADCVHSRIDGEVCGGHAHTAQLQRVRRQICLSRQRLFEQRWMSCEIQLTEIDAIDLRLPDDTTAALHTG